VVEIGKKDKNDIKTSNKTQLCMSGCSNKVWLKKVECQGILHIEKGFSEKCPLSHEDFEFLGSSLLKSLQIKNGFLQNGYLSKINQGSGPTRVSRGFFSFTLFLQVTHSF
jgi:hypothetical protein